MPLCRQCGKDWPAGYDACPNDGHLLEADTAASPSIHTPESLGVREADARWSSEPAVALNQERIADLEPGTRIGEYCVEFKLGEGGMGSVYAATHPLIGKKAAVKIISAALCSNVAAVERFVQEARAVNQIGHPNIVDVFSFGELHDGRSYFVMEWLQGCTLEARIHSGRMMLGEAAAILEQVCDAL